MEKEWIIMIAVVLSAIALYWIYRQFEKTTLLTEKEDRMYEEIERERFLFREDRIPMHPDPGLFKVFCLFFFIVLTLLFEDLKRSVYSKKKTHE